MSKIEQSVDLFIVFYQGSWKSSHSLLKPVDIVAKAIINSPLDIEEADLLWQIQGELKNWLDRVRSRQAVGRAMFYGKQITEQEEPAIRKFVLFFYNAVFKEYCQGERGILRSRTNQFKDGCEAYYMHLIHQQRIQDQEDEVATEATTV